ncbi:CDP-glycerol glycerophosphotransferase family protein [uncultured Faecalicoccus sp.]|uniref:CDP-glycerol glycerophosphotransferase family protein n=1 Tax=uncultured Faecalicoccus sp. TaxID=1971760 RepID=UPI0025DB6529|nr:CDP-glycerol glycerophosphotransferase family protein [uncultured Faecalicoccus sp.]
MFFLRLIKKWAGKLIRLLYKMLYRFVSVDDKQVIFISFHGRGYSDNPRAIYEAMIQDPRWQGYRFIWFIKHHKKKGLQIPGAEIKEYFSFSYFYHLSKAKFWVVNCKLPLYICKKPEQVYLQTWHGTPLKRLAHDIDVAEDTTFYRSAVSYEQMCHSYDVDVARYNYMISPNAFCTEVFPHAFGIDPQRLVETGYPRNDFIVNATQEQILSIKNRLQLPMDKKIILYAPTWRDNSYVSAGYTFELKADFRLWKKILGEDFIVLFKPHYLIINKYQDDPSLKGFLYSIPAAAEINELYVISDILITDYSSVFFDYAILKRPMYFYMYDLENYASDLRGFYLDITKDLPGKIYRSEEKLCQDIQAGVYDRSKLDDFSKRFNNLDDGHASKRVLDLLAGEQA